MRYDESKIVCLYQQRLADANEVLAQLDIAEGRKPDTNGLPGWVFEKTVQYCLGRELSAAGISFAIEPQVAIAGRAKVDLLVGRCAIELKSKGLFSANDAVRYREYRRTVEKKGWVYLYLAMSESYKRYKADAKSAF